jgi:surface antigen
MKKQALLGTLIAATVLQSASPAFAGKEEVGNIIGGVIGGVIGSQIGGGNGKTVATIIGAIAGSMIGGNIGHALGDADRRALGDAQRDCFQRGIGQRVDWDGGRYGSRTGARGSFTSTREGYNYRTGEYCREYESMIYVGGRQERTAGIACSRADGSWYETRRDEVRYDEGGLSNHRPPRYPGPGYGPGRPEPGRPGPGPGYPPPNPGRPTPPPPPPGYGQYSGTAQINQITRQGGGRWYRISLQQPLALSNVEVRVLNANVRLHEAALVTDYGQRLPIYEMSNTPVLGQNATVGSYINRNDRIVAIDIRAESFGAYADVLVNVTSRDGYPSLIVTPY